MKRIILLLFAIVMLPACLANEKPVEKNQPIADQGGQPLSAFSDIHPSQIGEEFVVLGETYLSILLPSKTVELEGFPDDGNAYFAGVLKNVGEDKWKKIARVTNLNPEAINNVIEVWEQAGGLRITVADDLKTETRDGTHKGFVLWPSGVWQMESCGSYTIGMDSFQDHYLEQEYFQYSSFIKKYQSGPVRDEETGDDVMTNEPTCDDVRLTTIGL